MELNILKNFANLNNIDYDNFIKIYNENNLNIDKLLKNLINDKKLHEYYKDNRFNINVIDLINKEYNFNNIINNYLNMFICLNNINTMQLKLYLYAYMLNYLLKYYDDFYTELLGEDLKNFNFLNDSVYISCDAFIFDILKYINNKMMYYYNFLYDMYKDYINIKYEYLDKIDYLSMHFITLYIYNIRLLKLDNIKLNDNIDFIIYNFYIDRIKIKYKNEKISKYISIENIDNKDITYFIYNFDYKLYENFKNVIYVSKYNIII